MWLFTIYGFFSIVSYVPTLDAKTLVDQDLLMVRARCLKHLTALKTRFPELAEYDILKWPGRDYSCRMLVPRPIWMQVVSQMVEEQTWSNFKTEAGTRFGHRSKFLDALHEIWSVMFHFGSR